MEGGWGAKGRPAGRQAWLWSDLAFVSLFKLYEDLVIENEKLKEQLQEAQLQLTQIKLELERVTQVLL